MKLDLATIFFFFFQKAYKASEAGSHPQVFRKKNVLKNFAKFSGKHLCQRFFNVFGGHSLQLY